MEGPHPYPSYHEQRSASMMHDAPASTHSPDDERSYKRRRLDPSLPDENELAPIARAATARAEAAAAAPSAAHQWAAAAPPQHSTTSPYAARHDATSSYRGSSSFGGPETSSTVTQHSSHDSPSRWQTTEPAIANFAPAYPEVPSYQHQPYFYEQPASRPAPTPYSSDWPQPDSRQSYPVPAHGAHGPATTSSQYHSRDQTTSAVMPYFPAPSAKSASVEAAEPAESAPTYQYADPEATAQYPYPQPESTALQNRDAAGRSSGYYVSDDASMNMKIQSLPILDNLVGIAMGIHRNIADLFQATQLIHTLSSASYPQIKELMGGGDAEESQAYATLKSLFDQTRKVYSRDTPFIDAIAIQMFQPAQQEIIRKANIATFISSILGAFDVTFYHLNEYFMETFVPLGHRLLKWQGGIYLDMKTQTYISSLLNSQGSPEALLDELFPPDLDAQILTRHPDAPSLSPSEQDFIDRSRKRKKYLLAEPASAEAARELQKKYSWQDFSREFASCISKNVDSIMNVPARTQTHSSKNAAAGNAADPLLAPSLAFGKSGGAGAGSGAAGGTAPGETKPGAEGAGKKSSAAGAASSTVRQPWTKPEEDALLSGLEKVNGPHWSQILALYGRGGSINEVLKDRNQVQLKDKARNLKLWYLKTGKEVPPALRGVTGELRKRGGARARAAFGLLDDNEGDSKDGVDKADGEDKKGAKKKAKK